MKGSITAAGSMTVRASGKVSGTINAQNLSVYPGALLNIEGKAQDQDAL